MWVTREYHGGHMNGRLIVLKQVGRLRGEKVDEDNVGNSTRQWTTNYGNVHQSRSGEFNSEQKK